MSYILDALKKSAQERQQGKSPHLYSIHSTAPPRKNSTPFSPHQWLGLLGVGGVLGICLGIFLFINRQDVPPSLPASHQASSGEKTTESVGQKPAPQGTQQETQPEAQAPSQKIVVPADTRPKVVPQVTIKENNVVLRTMPLMEKTLPAKAMLPTSGETSTLAQLQDLPADIRAAVPELKFAGHTYSEDPAQRMIIVNGQILREGGIISSGTRLRQITWDGVIVDFQGKQFLVKTN